MQSNTQQGAQVVISLQQKGGAGKTTMITCMAGRMAEDGAKVLFVDTEPKHPGAKWCDDIDHPNLSSCEIEVEEDLAPTVESQKGHYDVIFIDTAGWDSRMATYAIGLADLILIPAKASKKDTEQAVRTFVHASHLTKNNRIVPNIRIALWGLKQNASVSDRIRNELQAANLPLLQRATSNLTGYEQMDWNGGMPTGAAQTDFRQWFASLTMENLLPYYSGNKAAA